MLDDNLLGDNSLSDNLLGSDSLGDDNPLHMDSNINMDTKVKSNPSENKTGGNFLEETSRISIENLFQQV